MAAGDIIEVGIVVNVNGEETATILHCEQTTGNLSSLPLASELLTALENTGIVAGWQNRSSDEATLHCLKATVIYPTRSAPTWAAATHVGTITEESLPAAVGALHHWQAPPYVETSKGQHTWAGVPKTLHHRNRLTEGGLLLEGTFGELFQDPMVDYNTFEWGVWSQKLESFQALGVVSPRIVLRVIRSRKPVTCI